jgi:hypothetical protein
MGYRMILCAAGLAFACSLAAGQAEVLAISSGPAISVQPPMSSADVFDETDVGGVETEADVDPGTPVTVAPETSTWVTALLSFADFGR